MSTNASRQLIRTAIANWISAATIPNLNQVLPTFPKKIFFQTNAAAGQLNRAVGVVHIAHEDESRVAWAGSATGWKQVDFTIDFQIFHLSLEKKAEAGMESYDAVIDGVKDTLRGGGHTLGLTDGSVWQVAEPSITVDYGMPWIDGNGATQIWASVQFKLTQMINK